MSRIECLEGLLGVPRPATAIFCPSSCSMAPQAVDEYNAAKRFNNYRINGVPDILSYGLLSHLYKVSIPILGPRSTSSISRSMSPFFLRYQKKRAPKTKPTIPRITHTIISAKLRCERPGRFEGRLAIIDLDGEALLEVLDF